MREPESLAQTRLKEKPVLSDVVAQHAEEAKISHRLREHVLGLQDWIRRMQTVDGEKK